VLLTQSSPEPIVGDRGKKKCTLKGKDVIAITGTRFVAPLFFKFVNSSLLWDVFIINSVEQLQTLPKTQSEIDISPCLKTQKPSSTHISLIFIRINKF
jgi:hypothetical protein